MLRSVAKLEGMLIKRCLTKALQGYEFYLYSFTSEIPAKRSLCAALKLYSKKVLDIDPDDDYILPCINKIDMSKGFI